MFNLTRRPAAHSRRKAPLAPVGAEPVRIGALGPGFLRHRPYDNVVLGQPARYRERDTVTVIDADSTHYGRTGAVDAIVGIVLPVFVVFEGGGAAFFDPGQLGLVQGAPTIVFPAITDDTLTLDDLELMGGKR